VVPGAGARSSESRIASVPGPGSPSLRPVPDDALLVGSTVLYRPPGDRRAYPCQVEKIDGSRAYLVADTKPFAGWVDVASLSSAAASETFETGPV
jgi:hypothetical protein